MFIDTHCHLNMCVKKEFDTKLEDSDYDKIQEIVEQSSQNNVGKIITIGTSLIESINSIDISKRFNNVYAVVGIHPCDCKDNFEEEFLKIRALLQNKKENKIVAVGETGLDFFHKPYDKELQEKAFRTHIELAIDNNLPIVVHVRNSAEDVLRMLLDYKNKARGVIHCFMQNEEYAKSFLELGFYLGINAPITYPKNKEFRTLVSCLPLDRLLLETDSPFLPPQSLRGKANRPEYILIFAKIIADLKNIDLQKLEEITTNNAQKLFDI